MWMWDPFWMSLLEYSFCLVIEKVEIFVLPYPISSDSKPNKLMCIIQVNWNWIMKPKENDNENCKEKGKDGMVFACV